MVGVLLVLAVARWTEPAVKRVPIPALPPLAVFERARTAADILPARVAARLPSLAGDERVPVEFRNAPVRLAESRLLLSGVGSLRADLYAIPTANGGLCYAFTRGPQSCLVELTAKQPVSVAQYDPDGPGRGRPSAVAGIAPNDVVRIDVVIGGRRRRAILRNNAYFYEASNARDQPSALIVRFRDGKRVHVELVRIRLPD
jgi:hypothetical protein